MASQGPVRARHAASWNPEHFVSVLILRSAPRWLTDTVFGMTYHAPVSTPAVAP